LKEGLHSTTFVSGRIKSQRGRWVHVIIKYAKRYLRVRRSTTPPPPPYTSYLHPYTTATTTTQPLQHYYTPIWGIQGTREYRDGINKPEAYIRKKAPTGQQSLSRRRRRRQSPCQQAQVMINVLERSSSRSLLVRVLSGGSPTLSSGRNVLGILAQPSPSPRAFPASITDSKCIKVPTCISPSTLSHPCRSSLPSFLFFLSTLLFFWGGELYSYTASTLCYAKSKRDFSAKIRVM